MVFVDANYFLRGIVQPVTEQDRIMHAQAAALFAAVEQGSTEITTSEAILDEVTYILSSPRQYNLPPAEIGALLTPILSLPGFRLPRGRKRLYLRALTIWSERPSLGFVDALTVAELGNGLSTMPLATFDSDFDDYPEIARYVPPPLDDDPDEPADD